VERAALLLERVEILDRPFLGAHVPVEEAAHRLEAGGGREVVVGPRPVDVIGGEGAELDTACVQLETHANSSWIPERSRADQDIVRARSVARLEMTRPAPSCARGPFIEVGCIPGPRSEIPGNSRLPARRATAVASRLPRAPASG